MAIDTHYANPRRGSTALPERLCYDFLQSWPLREVLQCVSRGHAQQTTMMCPDRSTLSCRSDSRLCFVLIGLPGCGAFRELWKIRRRNSRGRSQPHCRHGRIFPAKLRNLSPLQPAEVARVEQALKAELQDRGVRLSASGRGDCRAGHSLGELAKLCLDWRNSQGDASQVVMVALERPLENRAFSGAMPVTMRVRNSGKGLSAFWTRRKFQTARGSHG